MSEPAPAAPLLDEKTREALCRTDAHYSWRDEPNPADCARCVRARGLLSRITVRGHVYYRLAKR